MLYLLLGMSFIFLFVGLIITPKNAPYLLAGFNTLTKEEQQQIKLEDYLRFFRKVHLFLSSSLLLVGLLIKHFMPGDSLLYWVLFYPLLIYLHMIFKSQKYFPSTRKNKLKTSVGISVLMLTIVAGGIGYASLLPSTLEFEDEKLIITGAYGLTLEKAQTTTSVVESLPKLKRRVNGVATQKILKGYFVTDKGTKIRVLTNSRKGPFIKFEAMGEVPVYYASDQDFSVLKKELQSKKWLP